MDKNYSVKDAPNPFLRPSSFSKQEFEMKIIQEQPPVQDKYQIEPEPLKIKLDKIQEEQAAIEPGYIRQLRTEIIKSTHENKGNWLQRFLKTDERSQLLGQLERIVKAKAPEGANCSAEQLLKTIREAASVADSASQEFLEKHIKIAQYDLNIYALKGPDHRKKNDVMHQELTALLEQLQTKLLSMTTGTPTLASIGPSFWDAYGQSDVSDDEESQSPRAPRDQNTIMIDANKLLALDSDRMSPQEAYKKLAEFQRIQIELEFLQGSDLEVVKRMLATKVTKLNQKAKQYDSIRKSKNESGILGARSSPSRHLSDIDFTLSEDSATTEIE
ncbi:MAG: hypothetical protein WCK49_03235 [Myxococcaceae bacterium]